MYYRRQKKLVPEHNNGVFVPGVTNYPDAFALPAVLNRIDGGRYGSVTKDFEAICARRMQMINFLSTLHHTAGNSMVHGKVEDAKVTFGSLEQTEGKESTSVIILDSDDEDGNAAGCKKQVTPYSTADEFRGWLQSNVKDRLKQAMLIGQGGSNTQIVPYGQSTSLVNQYPSQASWQPSIQYEKVILQKVPEEERVQDLAAASHAEKIAQTLIFPALTIERSRKRSDPTSVVNGVVTAPRKRKRKNEPKPTAGGSSFCAQQTDLSLESCLPMDEEEEPEKESDGLTDLWKDMSLAMESSKIDTIEEAANEHKEEEDCNHSFVLRDDLGLVCRVCGVIQKKIDTIFDYQWKKPTRTRASFYEPWSKNADEVDCGAVKICEDLTVSEISIHPRHLKQMRPHQLEGFNFLVKNLVTDKPGGCILAHAPGSGKTFMLISFIQSFLAKYPSARPLVVLPKGILGTWKREFQRWQVEDIQLYDFYSVKAEKRTEQLEILNAWQDKMSILFLGYKQFSTIICHDGDGKVAAACRERLLKVPNLLILDEGHTPRNQDTDVLDSLVKVQTSRKVVLSGTLFQNHVREVFNILNLVRPKFLKMESSRAIVRRVMSQVALSCSRRPKGVADNAFFDSVEDTLQNDENFTRKAHVIRHLRELTKDVLHYYKGDFLDELPGLIDFSVFLKLTPKQKDIVRKLEAFEKFKRSAVGTATYIHPWLSEISEVAAVDRAASLNDAKIDSMIDSINVRDGVKARFFLNILSLADSAGEKLLAFSQYILPLKFLERLLVKMRGWHVGKEIFMISGDTTAEDREWAMEQFNNSAEAKVLFGSIKACGEGISLVGASRVVILDVHLNPSVTRQAIGRAFRPGQEKKVYVYRLVAADSPEEKFHCTAFKKEVIPKLWFEWSEYCSTEDFNLDEIDIDGCEDELLESNVVRQDVKTLYRR